MQCDDEPMTFTEQLVIAVAPAAVAALIEHVLAPAVGLVLAPPQAPPKRRSKAKQAARSRAASRSFAAFVAFEKRRG